MNSPVRRSLTTVDVIGPSVFVNGAAMLMCLKRFGVIVACLSDILIGERLFTAWMMPGSVFGRGSCAMVDAWKARGWNNKKKITKVSGNGYSQQHIL